MSEPDDDFGGEVIPKAIFAHRVYGFDFDGYWEDVGTIRSFYETNLSLAGPEPPFDFSVPGQPIFSRPRFLPSTVVNGASLRNVLLADGCRIGEASIENAVVGLRTMVHDRAQIKNTVIMGADYFGTQESEKPARVPWGIGANCQIEGALIDKNPRIGENVVIRPYPKGTQFEGDRWEVRDGIVVIPKNTTIPTDTEIGPGA